MAAGEDEGVAAFRPGPTEVMVNAAHKAVWFRAIV